MRITWHSHSCFSVEADSVHLLFDPFLSRNPKARISAESVRCTHIFCSHAHDDHIADAADIARRNRAPLFAPYELAEYFSAQGLEAIDLMHGGGVETDFGHVKLTPAIHSSAIELGEGKNLAMGNPGGFLVRLSGKRIYHAGDTALFSDMHLIGRDPIDVAMLPVGDFYTMGIDDAVAALDYLCPKLALPMHYNTTEKIRVKPRDFVEKAARAGHHARVLDVEETVEI